MEEREISYSFRIPRPAATVPPTFFKYFAQINLDTLDCLTLCLVD
jgi:hypothetical protein